MAINFCGNHVCQLCLYWICTWFCTNNRYAQSNYVQDQVTLNLNYVQDQVTLNLCLVLYQKNLSCD
ncbi:hypothetical protein OIU79_026178 [Salix purpurea]|uniref:Uncharacterized protein n=1 Tax=Salix purpurea TaxID=77065 RepID=A0A9Q0VT97_SALPP|nr:hypothetical protein OIU79_026178 [Salix purpurea]